MANSADPDQLASLTDLDLHCLQRHGISGFSRTKVKLTCPYKNSKPLLDRLNMFYAQIHHLYSLNHKNQALLTFFSFLMHCLLGHVMIKRLCE